MLSRLIDAFKRETWSTASGTLEQDERFVHLKSWHPNRGDTVDISQDIVLSNDAKESAALNFSFWLKTPLLMSVNDQDHEYDYKVGLRFNNWTQKRYAYKIGFQASRTRAGKLMQWDRLFEREVVRRGNTVEFEGDFKSKQLYVNASLDHSVNFHLYCYVRRYECRSSFVGELEGDLKLPKGIKPELARELKDCDPTIRSSELEEISSRELKEAELRIAGNIRKSSGIINKRRIESTSHAFDDKATKLSEPKCLPESRVRALCREYENLNKVQKYIDHDVQLQKFEQRAQWSPNVDTYNDEDQLTCCICCANRVNVVLIPCGHANFCDKCVEENRRRGEKLCMLCRQLYREAHRFLL